MKIQPKVIKSVRVRNVDDILEVVDASIHGHTASSAIVGILIADIKDGQQERLEGVATFLHNLADAIDDGVLVA